MAKPTPSRSPKASKSKSKSTEQENFEKELQNLAAKAKEETFSKWALQQILILAQAATVLTLAAIYSNVSQLTLSPVYGSIPSSIYHHKGVITACFLGWSSNLYIKRLLPVKISVLLPLIAAYIPVLQFFLFRFSGFFGGRWGPVIIEGLTFSPLLLLSVSYTATVLEDIELTSRKYAWLSDAMPGISSFVFYKTMEYFSGQTIQRNIGLTFFHTRLGLQIVLSGIYALFAPSKLLLFAVPALLHTLFLNPHVPSTAMTTYLNNTMIVKGWSLLERKESLTGYISILESAEKGFRVMRCDHSLLGGEWLPTITRTGRREPIYGIFVMLEAVRLIVVDKPVPDNEAKALVIGLGIGTTPAALQTHGINTTVVEIDPVVYEFAAKYFAFPPQIHSVIADAVSYTSDLAKTDEKYDYIVHDVFTGGAEPVELFTVEFIQNLRTLLKPDGVIAINYASDLLLPSARIVIRTILTTFPTCRIYRESPSTENSSTPGLDFTNMVIFCTLSASDSISFREPVQSDYLDSGARRMFLVPKWEMDRSAFLDGDGEGKGVGKGEGEGLLYANATEAFKGWQESSALGHWGVMRTVLPEWVWEGW